MEHREVVIWESVLNKYDETFLAWMHKILEDKDM